MSRHSTAATRAARRSFWGSPVLAATGRFLDRSRPLAGALTVWLVVAGFAVVGSLQDFKTPAPAPVSTLTPCPTEDSSYCYWDAHSRGNGKGRSFIAFGDNEPHLFLDPIPTP